jgi:hypothetical protein
MIRRSAAAPSPRKTFDEEVVPMTDRVTPGRRGSYGVLPKPIRGWTLTTLREKLVKIGAKVVTHAKYVVFQLAEVAVPRQLFARILEQVANLRPACASG